MAATVTGATAAAGTFIDPAGEAISGKLSNTGIKWVTKHSSTLVGVGKIAVGFTISGTGSVMQSDLAGTGTDPLNVTATAASGAGDALVPVESAQEALNPPTGGTSGQWAAAAVDSAIDTTSEVLRKLLGLG